MMLNQALDSLYGINIKHKLHQEQQEEEDEDEDEDELSVSNHKADYDTSEETYEKSDRRYYY